MKRTNKERTAMTNYKTIAESNNFIVLDRYTREWNVAETGAGYQSESDLERELIDDLRNQGYEFVPDIKSPASMLANVRAQLQTLNSVAFSEGEWIRFVEEFLDKPNDGIVDKTRKVHDNYIHDFVFDDGHIQNIYLFDKKNFARNKLQVIEQVEQAGTQANRYDVTILVNGLPLVQIELKKRGVAIREAFNQVHRYSKESFNSANSLYKYLQIFVISNGTDSRYFANTTKRDKNSFDFTMNWAKADNEEQDAIGEILDESFETSAMDISAKEFLSAAIDDYNAMFQTNYGVDSDKFQNYYRDLSNRMVRKEIDLLIVVGMFLTGFDAPTLNTIFIDKNLRYHGLIQAYSRTNRIYDATKTFGNIVTFRDLEQATIDAITLFGDKNTRNVVLEKSYKEYMAGFTDIATGEARRGYLDVVRELQKNFPKPEEIDKEKDKKEFAKLFGEYLRIEHILQNYGGKFNTLRNRAQLHECSRPRREEKEMGA
jgi:type I site-specific restriction-modification system R (restriction) subunit